MFKKILIANRGEIACRVIKTARKMGIATVAVHSEADKDAPHVRTADEAVSLGPPAAAESYLNIDKILDAARRTGAEAVHPGYGFLSENAEFVRRVADAGLTFIGPPAEAITRMGDKIESKRLAKAAGVNTIPGTESAVADVEAAVSAAAEIGLPVMLKAAAGGGGKGMRVARTQAEVREGFRAAASEAKSSFGDDRIFVEKFIDKPRHIEIQVLADGRGTTVHLFERECSVQRRHQKVVEECPSPLLDPETRTAMGAQAVALAEAVGYVSAGTVEFVADQKKNFYFLEMNTRLQVEHPVTEMVTGLDLVEQMIRIAAGEALPFSQESLAIDGWAVEARLYAEDPRRGFLPQIGRITRYRPPRDSRSVRVDTGIEEGSEISMFYDPMVAKLITWGATRAAAIDEMRSALDSFYIRGLEHNRDFLSAVVAHPRFAAGDLSTHFIETVFPGGFEGTTLSQRDQENLAAVAVFLADVETRRGRSISGQSSPRPAAERRDWVVTLDDARIEAAVRREDTELTVTIAERACRVSGAWRPGDPIFAGHVDGEAMVVEIDRLIEGYRLSHGGARLTATVRTPRVAELAALMPEKAATANEMNLISPMSGQVIDILVAAGQDVAVGEPLVVVEAMKMENTLRAERDARVAAVPVETGASVTVGDTLLEFE